MMQVSDNQIPLIPTDPDALLTEKQYAKLRNTSVRTIQTERLRGGGCPYAKIGRSVRYRRRDILEFIESHILAHTSDAGEAAK